MQKSNDLINKIRISAVDALEKQKQKAEFQIQNTLNCSLKSAQLLLHFYFSFSAV